MPYFTDQGFEWAYFDTDWAAADALFGPLSADGPYFDRTYFDAAYFETDAAPAVVPPLGGHRRYHQPLEDEPEPPKPTTFEDEELFFV